MRILDSNSNEITTYDPTKGYLINDTITVHIPYSAGVQEVGHYHVLKEFPNGGNTAEYIIDVEGKPEILEHDEEEQIYRYVPYTESELAAFEISELKNYLTSTDYTVIKCMERGLSVADTYPEVYQKREEARERINELEVLAAANEEDK